MPETDHRRPSRRSRKLWWLGVALLIFAAGAVVVVRIVIARAEPIVKKRVIDTLSARFQSKVELDRFEVSVAHGITVYGGGLKIFGATDPNPHEPGVQPLLSIQEFRFGSSLPSLFRTPMHIDTVYVKGMDLNIPPKGDRQEMTRMRSRTAKMKIVVDKFVCEDTRLVINTKNAQKPPLEIPISNLTMKSIGSGAPMQFDATLINPKPVGNIASNGLFGPFDPVTPGDAPVQGQYSFSHADLSTIKGIGGILSSTGEYSGTLNNIVVHGQTETPDFRIATGDHPVALHTEFHATVDGTSGNTYLHPVTATFLGSTVIAKGSVARVKTGHGHDIDLDVTIDHARIEDLLKLAVKTNPPVMSGPLEMQTKLNIPPGHESVTDKMRLSGHFHVQPAHFSNSKVQSKIDWLSLVSQGKPKEAKAHDGQDVPVDLRGDFTLDNGVLSFSLLHFLIPGTHVDMAGEYGLDGKTFDFRGQARMDATVSHMTTGWKSLLLKPVDPFFRKDGAGTEIPIKITGTEGAPHIGLDLGRGHKGE